MKTTFNTSTNISMDDLRASVRGQVIAPSDAGYDDARTVFYGGYDRHPAVIVRAADVQDVVKVVNLARESGAELAVRGGGHSLAGHSVSEGGIVLDLRELRGLEIDPANRTTWAEAGWTAGELGEKLGEHGLVLGFGDTGSVGISGITLGGGVGFLSRKYGLTIDNLIAADIVTADGQVLRASADSHPDLFWAIRGGGGNFGVVTRFQYRVQALPSIVGGMIFLPATPETITGFIEAAEAAPEELSTIANVMPAPPMPFVPKEAHGKMIIMGMMAYAGDAEAGQQALAPFRALAKPYADMLRPMRYAEMFPHEEGGDYHPTAVAINIFVDKIDRADAETILHFLNETDSPMRVAQLRVLGGAIARVPADATAYAHRRAKIMVNLAAFYMGADDRPKREAWVAEFAAALNQGNDGAYVNFVGDEGEKRVRAAYPNGTWNRLAEIKARYDPNNLFRLNQNIAPAAHKTH